MTRPAAARQFQLDIPPEMLEAMSGGGAIAQRISRREALQVPAVLRARNLICGTLGSLPHAVIDPGRNEVPGGTYLLGGNIDPDVANSVVLAQTYEDLLFEGIAWWKVTRFGWHGFPVEARHVPVESVHVVPLGGLQSHQLISPDQPFPADGQVYIDGLPVADREVIRFDSPNPPLLVHAARAIRTCLKLDRAAALYSDDPLPLGVFEPAEGAERLSDQPNSAADGTERSEVDALLDAWEEARASRAWGYTQGVTAKILQWSPEQLQLADARQHAVLEIARAAGIDPEDLGVSTTSRTYQNGEQRRQDLLDFTMGIYVVAVQDRLSMRDVLPRNYVSRVRFGGFLRSDTKTRMETYKVGLEVGAYTEDEIRDLEDRPRLTPAQRATARQRGASATPPAAPNGRAPNMSDPKPVTFTDDGEAVRVQFDSDEVAETFQVDVERRTITGMVVPWGKVARSGFSKWKFAPDSLRWTDASRTKLNLHHDFTALIGRATRLQSGNKGLMATFKVGRGPDGDRVLTQAEDKILDGFSIEVDFVDDLGDSWQPDPADESVRLVRQASLRGVALTGMPAFDDARVSSVKATRDGRKGAMPDDKKPAAGGQTATTFDLDTYVTRVGESMAASHKELVEGLTESIGESVSAGIKAALEDIATPQDGPQPVRAARFVVTREAPVYTLNGGGPSLVRDAWFAQMHHDEEATARVRKFRAQTEEMAKVVTARLRYAMDSSGAQFTTASTSNVSEVIPPGYRPDLFVPELAQGRPLVNALSRGTLQNATPFVVPVFGSATSATDDHVEGTNPTDGSLTMATKTVTPGAISGLLKLTREIVDSSNPAIDQIALQAMRESYAQQTEAKAYAALTHATQGTGGTITNGFVPSGAQASTVDVTDADDGAILVRHLRARLAAYPFARFAAPTTGLVNQEATSLLATAVDADGRPLLPSVGAQNASGLGNAVTQGWSIDGLPFVPAWSMSGTADTDTKAIMLARPDAWAWESATLMFRYEERSGPAVIDLALFGYFATHVLRPVGLSGIRVTNDVSAT
jgi:HK97 family phage prohead protease/HK97 family phage major capsid protein